MPLPRCPRIRWFPTPTTCLLGAAMVFLQASVAKSQADLTGAWRCQIEVPDNNQHSSTFTFVPAGAGTFNCTEDNYHFSYWAGWHREPPDNEPGHSTWHYVSGNTYSTDPDPNDWRAYLEFLDLNTIRLHWGSDPVKSSGGGTCTRVMPSSVKTTPVRLEGFRVVAGGCDANYQRTVTVSFTFAGGEEGKAAPWSIESSGAVGCKIIGGNSAGSAKPGKRVTTKVKIEGAGVCVVKTYSGTPVSPVFRVERCPSAGPPK
jgi:hypothetical protein